MVGIEARSGRKMSPDTQIKIISAVQKIKGNNWWEFFSLRQQQVFHAFESRFPILSQVARDQQVKRTTVANAIAKGLEKLQKLEKGELRSRGRPKRVLDPHRLKELSGLGIVAMARMLKADQRLIRRVASEYDIAIPRKKRSKKK